MRWVFHAMTTFVSSVKEPDIRNHFVAAPPRSGAILPGVDRALKLMNRSPRLSSECHFAPKLHVAEVITQKQRAQWHCQGGLLPGTWVALRRAAEPPQRDNCASRVRRESKRRVAAVRSSSRIAFDRDPTHDDRRQAPRAPPRFSADAVCVPRGCADAGRDQNQAASDTAIPTFV